MTDPLKIYEIGSEEFNAFQDRLNKRSMKGDVSLGGQPTEYLQRARDTGDQEFIEFAEQFYEGLPHHAWATVERVIEAVESGGDDAARHLARLFDGEEIPTPRIRVSQEDLAKCAAGVDQDLLKMCTEQMIPRLRRFLEKQKREGYEIEEQGGSIGVRVQPLRRVGVYVPDGNAKYPSTLMMAVVAAQVAGVEEIAVFSPAGTFGASPILCALIEWLGVKDVYRIGGAQGIAAAAIGTESIERVDKIVGPGNVFVAMAKQAVSERAGTDTFAGPSELVVVFDRSADPAVVAADLLAQAEHGVHVAAIGITDDEELAAKVQKEASIQVKDLPRQATIESALATFGGVITVPSMPFAFRLVDTIAPEHVELITENADEDAVQIRNAGAILIGPWAPETFSTYNAGPNHVLPTTGSARWASALGVLDFVREVSIIRGSKDLLAANKDMAIGLSRAEELEAHARSIEKRF